MSILPTGAPSVRTSSVRFRRANDKFLRRGERNSRWRFCQSNKQPLPAVGGRDVRMGKSIGLDRELGLVRPDSMRWLDSCASGPNPCFPMTSSTSAGGYRPPNCAAHRAALRVLGAARHAALRALRAGPGAYRSVMCAAPDADLSVPCAAPDADLSVLHAVTDADLSVLRAAPDAASCAPDAASVPGSCRPAGWSWGWAPGPA